MGTCESTNEKKGKANIRKNKGKQLFSAPIKSKNNDNNMTSNLTSTMNTISILDNKNLKYKNKNRPSLLYKYRGTYCKKGEQISIMTATLQDLQGNSLINNKIENNNTMATNSIYSIIDETANESSIGFEIIFDGKIDEDMVQKSTDKSTVDNYIEFVGKKGKINSQKNKIDIYSKNNKEKVENYINKNNHWKLSN